MAFEDSYVCLISALRDVKGINMDEVIKASSLAIKVLKLEIGKGDLKEFIAKNVFFSLQ